MTPSLCTKGSACLVLLGIALSVQWISSISAEDPPAATARDNGGATESEKNRTSLEVARAQAELLHATIHATLQAVHREYYREDEGLTIPSATLDKVFAELASEHKVKIHWLAVDAQAMNVDHQARDEFERRSVVELTKGKTEFEVAEPGRYRRTGRIVLGSQCLKCHLPGRTSNQDRAAGLVISIPIR